MMNEIQKKILNKLLDKFESSKTFIGENKTNQNFSLKIEKEFPQYLDSSKYDEHKKIDESIEKLENLDFVKITRKTNNIIDKIFLTQNKTEGIYKAINRPKRKDEQNAILEILEEYQNACNPNSPLAKYISIQKEKIMQNKNVEYFDGDFDDFKDLLIATNAIQNNEKEILIRTLSVSLFSDSKRLESLRDKIESLLYKYGEFENRETVLEECGVMKTPTTIKIKGTAIISIAGQKLDLSKILGDLEFSSLTLKEIDNIEILGERVVTIENLTSFYEYSDKNDFQIYLGGFHNSTKRDFLKMLYEKNQNKQYFHFGDIDAGGFYILIHLIKKTAIPFKPFHMDIKILENHKDKIIPLTSNDEKRLKDLLLLVDDEIKITIQYMLENNCKLEQENIIT